LQHILQVLTEPHKEREVGIIQGRGEIFSPSWTKSEDVVDHVNITHHILEEGIENTFILEKSLFLDEEKEEGSWGLYFNGAHSSTGSGAGIVLILLDNKTTLFLYMLEFNCKNNIIEYEALIIGINLAIDMNIKTLHVKGDYDLIISQFNKKFTTKIPRLKQYRDVTWDSIKKFEIFSIEAIPKEENNFK
jgi:ribonuclease HI